MILTDYFRFPKDIMWDYALQCGVSTSTVRLPETDFDITDFSQWKDVYQSFESIGVKPIIIEPMPNALHDHIKIGDSMRDECIEKVILMMKYMNELDIRTICFNFMAHIGWLRTSTAVKERGNAMVTGFDLRDFSPNDKSITAQALWDNYTYFIKAVIPYAEKYHIRLALHPDDPPLEKLGDIARIMISADNIDRAIHTIKSEMLGITMCQATYRMMGEDLEQTVQRFADKIFFVHFRNVRGNKTNFCETFHDNGDIDMAQMLTVYKENHVDVPIRVDHVPLMAGEQNDNAGYAYLGRLYAIGYLKGLLDGTNAI